jgi:hypothetical protein
MALAAVAMLGACASNPTVVVRPTPIRLLAVLPVAPLAEGESVGFGGQRPGTVVVPVAAPSAGAAAAAIGVGIVVAAVVQSARDEKHRERLALKEAMDVLSFDIAAQADQHLAAALQQHPGVVVVFVRDPALAAAVRAGRFDGLPAGVDAYLDISVDEAGFEKSRRAGGYAPVVNLGLTIRPLNEQGDDLASFVYYADTRDGGRNKRWWTTPPSMTFKTLDALKADAPAVRAGLDALLQQMSVSMARDISRRAAGEAVAND